MDAQTILGMTVAVLKEKLKAVGLSVLGRKSVLRDRLLRHYNMLQSDDEESEVDESTYEEAASPTRMQEISVVKNNFSLRDIEDSVSAFNGNSSHDVNQWVNEFEDIADTVGWNDLQKYVYGKQLLKGAAKLFIRGLVNIKSWNALKAALIEEFGTVACASEVHNTLRNRRKNQKETLQEYLYVLIEIGKPIGLDEQSLISYFVNGIPDSKLNKTVLYQARSLLDLKQQIRVYEKIKGPPQSFNKAAGFVDSKAEDKGYNQVQTKKCFKCNKDGHVAKDCRSNNITCFKCKQIGHYSYQCKEKPGGQTNFKAERVNSLRDDDEALFERRCGMIFTDVSLKDFQFSALVDTGCNLCLLRHDTYKMFGDIELKDNKLNLVGVGKGRLTTLGSFDSEIVVNNVVIPITFHVVGENDLVYSAILGNNVLEYVDVVFSKKRALFIAKDKSSLQSSKDNSLCEKVQTAENENDLFSEFKALCVSSFEDTVAALPDIDLSHLKIDEIKQIENIITSYTPIKPVSSPVEMKLILTDDIPVYQPPRKTSYSDKCVIENQIKEWLDEKIIVPSYSAYASPVVLVSKKNGTKRLCCDYRKLNAKIIKDNFPMAVIDEVLERLQEANIFCTLDLKNGFFHVPIEENSRKYTSFVAHNGQYEFCYVPFGISNSPAVFCRYVHAIFQNEIRNGTMVMYMDDIVIPAKDKQECFLKLKAVLEIGSQNGLHFNWSKCQFLKNKITFLGYIIENGTILPSTEKSRAVSNFPTPSNRKELQRFLGLTSYFRRFVDGYANKAKPLSDLLRKDEEFSMGEEQLVAIQSLKHALTSAPTLRLFNPRAITEVHTDASKFGYGAVMLQKDSVDQLLHPIEYMSKKTQSYEEKYSSYELEVLAIIQALKKWRVYLKDVKFKIVTDCNAFAQTIKKKDVPDRVMRWAMYLQEFNFEIEHRSGSRMKHVDALSRVYCLFVEDSLKYRIREAQVNDDWLRAVKQILANEEYDNFFLKNDIIYKDPVKELLVVPSVMEEEIIQLAHRQGHFAARKTQDLIEKYYFIPNLASKVSKIVKGCIECIVTDAKLGKKEGFLTPIDKAYEPLGTYHIDHVGPLTVTNKKYNHILVVIDGFSKFVWLYPTKSTGTGEVLEKLEQQAAIFGNPKRIVTDRGTAFTSNAFQQYCQHENIQHLLIATGVPRGNGQVERVHKIVIPMLSKLCHSNPESWYRHVSKIQQVMNSSVPRSTKTSPFKILTGINMRTVDYPDLRQYLEEATIEELDSERDTVREIARENILKIQQENRKTFNSKRKSETLYNVGDLVAIKRTQFGTNLKLKPKFLGPYRITDSLNHSRYKVEKVGESEGAFQTVTVAEFMKPWTKSFGSNGHTGRPNVGVEEGQRTTRTGQTY